MNESHNETAWHHPWKEICEGCNRMRGTNFSTQKDLLDNLYLTFSKNIPRMANFLGVHIVSLREKLVREGIREKKAYKKRKINGFRKIIRDSPDDAFINMTRGDLKKKFSEYSIIHVTKVLRSEGKQYKKKYYWAKYDKPKDRG